MLPWILLCSNLPLRHKSTIVNSPMEQILISTDLEANARERFTYILLVAFSFHMIIKCHAWTKVSNKPLCCLLVLLSQLTTRLFIQSFRRQYQYPMSEWDAVKDQDDKPTHHHSCLLSLWHLGNELLLNSQRMIIIRLVFPSYEKIWRFKFKKK